MLWSLVVSLAAQSGGNFTITKAVISGGGTESSSGGNFSLSGTLGQPIAGDELSGGSYAVNSGFWIAPVSGVGLEADTSPRPGGDGAVLSNDVVQTRRFLNGTALPDSENNEFQRADSSPRISSGDGLISSGDIVQSRRYQNGTDTPQTAAGPLFEGGSAFARFDKTGNAEETLRGGGASRELRVESTNATAGQSFTLNIRVDAVGDEAEYGFRVNYDSSKLSNPIIGAGNAGAAVRACNTAAAGVVNCSVGAFPNNNPGSTDPNIGEINAGNDQILITVTFNVSANAASGPSPLTLTNVNVSNDNADLLPISATNGVVNIAGPTAAAASLSGQIRTVEGNGIANVAVTLTNTATGAMFRARSSSFGYYRFEGVEVGQSYILTVSSKQYRFESNPRVFTLVDEATGVDFTALPEN